jgi:hypothetical protein
VPYKGIEALQMTNADSEKEEQLKVATSVKAIDLLKIVETQ